jgi:hypothetical protein
MMEHYIIQFYENTNKELINRVKKTLRYFMVEDKQLCLYYYIVENTIFIYTADKKNWNMSRLSIMMRGIMKGSDFIFYKVESYDGLMGKEFWNRKNDALSYFKDKDKFLQKFDRSMKIEKLIEDMGKPKDKNNGEKFA